MSDVDAAEIVLPGALLTDPRLRVGADLDRWLELGGGDALRRALDDPDAALAAVDAAGLRGMGGAGYPAARKWAPVAESESADKWVVCNGNEDEPGTFKDAALLRHTPHQVVEGALVAAAAVGAAHAVMYVNGRAAELVAVVRRAVAQWREHPRTAALLRGGRVPIDLDVVVSNGMYVAGEETAVIATVEGRFPFPRSKPPFPATHGVFGRPTVVNNVETLAQALHVVRLGPDAWRASGGGALGGTKLYSLSGDVVRPGLYELPLGVSLRELVFEHGGGLLSDKAFKAVFTGGPSHTLLTGADLDVALDFESLRARGARLGTGAMIVLSEGTSIVRKLGEYMRFFSAGSCGQCPSCKIGTHEAHRLLARLDAGEAVAADLDALDHLGGLMLGSGRCGLVDGAATVLASSLRTFGAEYRAHLPSTGDR